MKLVLKFTLIIAGNLMIPLGKFYFDYSSRKDQVQSGNKQHVRTAKAQRQTVALN